MDDALLKQLVRHEGLQLFPYTDTVGKLTIGVGRNLTDVGISQDEAVYLLRNDVAVATADLETFAWWAGLTPVRQRALLDLRFNLGPGRFRQFQAMIDALRRRDYPRVADEMRESKWARQVGRRSDDLARMMETGLPPADTTLTI